MGRLFAAFLAVVACLSPLTAAPVPKAGPPLYFPTTVGAEWVYEGAGREDETAVVSRVGRDGDGSAVVSRAAGGGNGLAYTDVVVDADGLRQDKDGPDGPRTAWLMKARTRRGDSWDAPDGRRTTHGPEPIEVPAGKFVAVRVVLEADGETTTSWYAAGVGEVKRVVRVGNGPAVVTRSLKSFRPK